MEPEPAHPGTLSRKQRVSLAALVDTVEGDGLEIAMHFSDFSKTDRSVGVDRLAEDRNSRTLCRSKRMSLRGGPLLLRGGRQNCGDRWLGGGHVFAWG
jgi:hypothetical protein